MALSLFAALDDSARRFVPLVSTLILLIVSFMQLPLPYAGSLMPPLALMGTFYWSVYRPDRFGILAAFAIGLMQDLLMGSPLGITAFLYAALQQLLARRQHIFKGGRFALLWIGYIAAQVMVSAAQWLCWSWLAHRLYPVTPFALQLVLALCLFPPIGWGLSRLHTAFLHNR